MAGGWAQVLSDGENAAVHRGQIADGAGDLVPPFPGPQHDAGLGGGRPRPPGPVQEFEGALVASLRAHYGIETRRRFDVVIEDVRTGAEDGFQRLPVALEIWDEDFDRRMGAAAVQLLQGAGEDAGAAVGKFVAVDRGDHRMAQLQVGHGGGDAVRFILVQGLGPPGLDGAKAAASGAYIAQNHEGRRAPAPALADIGTMGALAHGVEVEAAHQVLEL